MKPTQKEFCKKHNLTQDQFFGKEEIGGDLDLRGLTSIPEGFKNTLITVNYYRLLTGSCQSGVEAFRKAHGLTKEKYKAKDLLPILEKNQAYGLERFKKLVDF